MPVKKSVRSKTSAGAKKSSRSKTKSGMLGAGVIVMGMVCLMAVAMVMAARESSDAPEIRTPDVQAQAGSDRMSARKAPVSKPSEVGLAATPTTGVIAADESAMESASESSTKKGASVTISGCLQRDNDAFRLKDTSGADAPKARSWKSGFLKKGSAAIDLVDAAGSARLKDNVGKRVSVTGTLTDRQMQVRSLRRVASSCQ